MKDNSLIYDLIDGELLAEREDELFYKLSNSNELKLQFKQIMAVKTAIASNTSIYTPPAASTNAIFAGLGLTVPGAASEAVKPSFYTTLRSHSFTSAASVIITILLFIFLYGPEGNYFSSNSGSSAIIPPGSPSNVPLATNNNIPYVSSYEDSPQNAHPQIRTVIKYIYIEKQPDQKENNYLPIEFSDQYNGPNLYKNQLFHQNDPNNTNYNPLMLDNYSPLDIESGLNTDYTLEIRNMQEFYHPEANITPTKFPKFNNMAINFMYNLNENISVGMDLRQENFFQRYTGMNSNGIPTYYEQTPNFTTIDANIRYTYTKFGTFYPFGQLSLGGNHAGTVFRGIIGTEIFPYKNLGFVLGYEFSSFQFSHQNNKFNSEKSGFNYGVSIKY